MICNWLVLRLLGGIVEICYFSSWYKYNVSIVIVYATQKLLYLTTTKQN